MSTTCSQPLSDAPSVSPNLYHNSILTVPRVPLLSASLYPERLLSAPGTVSRVPPECPTVDMALLETTLFCSCHSSSMSSTHGDHPRDNTAAATLPAHSLCHTHAHTYHTGNSSGTSEEVSSWAGSTPPHSFSRACQGMLSVCQGASSLYSANP